MAVETFNLAAVLPTFNNAGTLASVVQRVLKSGLPVMVVDDGCSDCTAEILGRFAARIHVIRHPHNRGKAAALRSGFAAARAAGFTHAITIDTDGQLDPAQIPQFIAASRGNPQALVIGARDEDKADYPSCSRAGRRVSNFLVLVEAGVKVSDSQCGFRIYPLDFLDTVKCSAERFGFETEILARAGWAGCPVQEIPVSCLYKLPDGRVSHFRPWHDSFRAAAMHARLLIRAIAPWPHVKWPPQNSRPKPTWRSWMSPRQAWREIHEGHNGRWRLALSIGVGVWIANLPIYPCQTLAALYAARRLHLNPLAAILGTQASMPPLNFVLIAASIGVGHFLLHGVSVTVSWNQFQAVHSWQLARTFAADWIVGGVLFGFALGAAIFGILLAILACIPLKRIQQAEVAEPLPPALSHPSQSG